MTGLLLSRLRLRRDGATRALAPLLLPGIDGARAGAAHRLMWSLFADGPDRARDFLWREDERPDGERVFYALSRRAPVDAHGLFAVETRAFDPALRPGARLAFRLRANATAAARAGVAAAPLGVRGKRLDVVMARMRRDGLVAGSYGGARDAAALDAARAWLARQGEGAGFRLALGELTDADGRPDPVPALAVDGYRVVRVPRGAGSPIRMGVLDLAGDIEIDDPSAFLAALGRGFGRGRAFGLGLMMIRRARVAG